MNEAFGGKPEGKKPLEKRRSRWKDVIIIDLKNQWYKDINWIHLA